MKLTVGQTIDVLGKEAKVLGRIGFLTHDDYHVEIDGMDKWLESTAKDWILWSAEIPDCGMNNLKRIILQARFDLLMALPGKNLMELPGMVFRECNMVQVTEVEGDVGNARIYKTILYLKGAIIGSEKLFAIKEWGTEVGFFEGQVLEGDLQPLGIPAD